MSAEQPPKETPSTQREKDLSAKLEQAEYNNRAHAQRESKLLAQLLEAKTALLEASQQHAHQLSIQLKEKTAELEVSHKREKLTLTELEKLTSELEGFKKRSDDPSLELLEKEAALVASRQQERQLSMEPQNVRNDFASYIDRRQDQDNQFVEAKGDLKQSQEFVKVQSGQLQEAEKKVRQLSEELKQVKQSIDTNEAIADKKYQQLWSRHSVLLLQSKQQEPPSTPSCSAPKPRSISSVIGLDQCDQQPQESKSFVNFKDRMTQNRVQQTAQSEFAKQPLLRNPDQFTSAKFGKTKPFSFANKSQQAPSFNFNNPQPQQTAHQNKQQHQENMPTYPDNTKQNPGQQQRRQQQNQPQQGSWGPKRSKGR